MSETSLGAKSPISRCAGVCCSGSVTSMLRSNSFLPTDTDRSSQHPDRRVVAVPAVPGTGRTSQTAPRPDVASKSWTTETEIRDFLTTRRAKITPDRAGLPAYGGNRRVAGLRREEVALLAGVSVDYYTRLERGNLTGVSDSVLEALGPALQLDEAERAHLFDLARTANTTAATAGPAAARPAARAARGAAPPRRDDHGPGVRAQRPPRRARRQPTRPGRLRAAVRHRGRGRRTSPGSSSSTPPRRTSTSTGNASPATRWRCCAPRPAATRTTGP